MHGSNVQVSFPPSELQTCENAATWTLLSILPMVHPEVHERCIPDLPVQVLAETERFVAVLKPAGMPCQVQRWQAFIPCFTSVFGQWSCEELLQQLVEGGPVRKLNCNFAASTLSARIAENCAKPSIQTVNRHCGLATTLASAVDPSIILPSSFVQVAPALRVC